MSLSLMWSGIQSAEDTWNLISTLLLAKNKKIVITGTMSDSPFTLQPKAFSLVIVKPREVTRWGQAEGEKLDAFVLSTIWLFLHGCPLMWKKLTTIKPTSQTTTKTALSLKIPQHVFLLVGGWMWGWSCVRWPEASLFWQSSVVITRLHECV